MAILLQGIDKNSSAYQTGQMVGQIFMLVLAAAVAFRIYKWVRNR